MKFFNLLVRISDFFAEQREKLKLLLAGVKYICLTTDRWTSKANTSFTGLTCHFLDENGKRKTKLLDCVKFDGRRTEENIANGIKKILEFYQITSKIVSVTVDHADEGETIRNLGLQSVECFGHNIDLIVQDVLKSVPELSCLRDKISNIVSLTKNRASAKKRFKTCRRSISGSTLQLCQAEQNRWNSIYEMFERFLQLKAAITWFMAEESSLESLSIKEWSDLSSTVNILRPLYDIVVELSAEKYSTISKVIPLASILRQFYLDEAAAHPNQSMAREILNSLQFRFDSVEDNNLLAVSTLLDPRFKSKLFDKPDTIVRAKKFLGDEAFHLVGQSPPSEVPPQESSNSSKVKLIKVFTF